MCGGGKRLGQRAREKAGADGGVDEDYAIAREHVEDRQKERETER